MRGLLENLEFNNLSPRAAKSYEAHREQYEDICEVRTEYQRDRDRILHSKAFRRLKHKTQVFLSPEGDHYRTRLTHTLEVAQIARTIARALRLNEDLTEAIALGHDLGHTPFGHRGESILNDLYPKGFKHNEQSLRVVDFLERRKPHIVGLNLTEDVKDGILNHTGYKLPKTLEGQIVRISDRVAYINHDIDDAIRAKLLEENDLPKESLEVLGYGHGKRIDSMIKDLIISNQNLDGDIRMSEVVSKHTNILRKYMFENIYTNVKAKSQEDKAEFIMSGLYNHYCKNPQELPMLGRGLDIEEDTKDYIAGMSDRFCVNKFKEIYIPKYWG